MNAGNFREAAALFAELSKLYYASFGPAHPEVNKNEQAVQLCETRLVAADRAAANRKR